MHPLHDKDLPFQKLKVSLRNLNHLKKVDLFAYGYLDLIILEFGSLGNGMIYRHCVLDMLLHDIITSA